jgi:hypothetical protein
MLRVAGHFNPSQEGPRRLSFSRVAAARRIPDSGCGLLLLAQVFPLRVHRLDQAGFPSPRHLLDLFLTGDRFVNVGELLEVDQAVGVVSRREGTGLPFLVLESAAFESQP